jgi:hypothetical protein
MTQAKLQKTPFRIRLRGCGTFIAIAADGTIEPKSARARRDALRPSVRSAVEAFATAYLKRRDWTWKTKAVDA